MSISIQAPTVEPIQSSDEICTCTPKMADSAQDLEQSEQAKLTESVIAGWNSGVCEKCGEILLVPTIVCGMFKTICFGCWRE